MGVGAVILPTFGRGLGTALWTLFLLFGSISERPSLHRIKITFAAAQGLHGLQSMILASISAFSEARISTGEGEKIQDGGLPAKHSWSLSTRRLPDHIKALPQAVNLKT